MGVGREEGECGVVGLGQPDLALLQLQPPLAWQVAAAARIWCSRSCGHSEMAGTAGRRGGAHAYERRRLAVMCVQAGYWEHAVRPGKRAQRGAVRCGEGAVRPCGAGERGAVQSCGERARVSAPFYILVLLI